MIDALQQTSNWDRYRYFLAVAETGSLSAAALALGVTHPTVRRQITLLESNLGTRLFKRTAGGYALSLAGREMLTLAQRMDAVASQIEQRTVGQQVQQVSSVRISASTGIGTAWLAPKLAEFRKINCDIEVELIIATGRLDLMRHEADVALRIGNPGGQDLMGRRIGVVKFGLYAANCYLVQRGEPRCITQLKDHVYIESTGEIEHHDQSRHLRKLAREAGAKPAMKCNNLLAQFAAMRAGVGILAVPSYMSMGVNDIHRILVDDFQLELELWLLAHPDIVNIPPVRKVVDFLGKQIDVAPEFNARN